MNVTTADSIADKRRALASVRKRLAAARNRLRQTHIEYTSTPDGACETYRRFELADGEERAALRQIYLAGLSMADHEYQRRAELGHANDSDGPLEALPLGSPQDPLVGVLVEHRVMGWVRSGPAALASGKVTVGLIRVLADGTSRRRIRLRCAVHSELGVFTETLATVVRQALADPLTRERLDEFLGAAASPAIAAAAQVPK
ncbi:MULTISPECIES: hypothetical protein [Mycobacteriaceae]|uniref:hypothetical protein n=1 Tax=Mycobacteriaceae TaxID=1762 RepID=UPI00026816F4|nr:MULTISPECIES: hypothetical protein [Mycobacteriaceae]EIU74823.1 hypothetical protein MA6G1108_5471 [Mycobacteroides abscessus 6G-1108]